MTNKKLLTEQARAKDARKYIKFN